jgi:hypothetical protein
MGCATNAAAGTTPPSWPGLSRPSTSLLQRLLKSWMPAIGERSDAVLRTAMRGHDDPIRLAAPYPTTAILTARRPRREKR